MPVERTELCTGESMVSELEECSFYLAVFLESLIFFFCEMERNDNTCLIRLLRD